MAWMGIPNKDDCGCCKVKTLQSYKSCAIVNSTWGRNVNWQYPTSNKDIALVSKPYDANSWNLLYSNGRESSATDRLGTVFDYIDPDNYFYMWNEPENRDELGLHYPGTRFNITQVSGGTHTTVFTIDPINSPTNGLNFYANLNYSYGELQLTYQYRVWTGTTFDGGGAVTEPISLSLNGGNRAGVNRYRPSLSQIETPIPYRFVLSRGESARRLCFRPRSGYWATPNDWFSPGYDVFVTVGAGLNNGANPYCSDVADTYALNTSVSADVGVVGPFTGLTAPADCEQYFGFPATPSQVGWGLLVAPFSEKIGSDLVLKWLGVIARAPAYVPPLESDPFMSYVLCERATAIYESAAVATYPASLPIGGTLSLKDSYITNDWCTGSFPSTISVSF